MGGRPLRGADRLTFLEPADVLLAIVMATLINYRFRQFDRVDTAAPDVGVLLRGSFLDSARVAMIRLRSSSNP